MEDGPITLFFDQTSWEPVSVYASLFVWFVFVFNAFKILLSGIWFLTVHDGNHTGRHNPPLHTVGFCFLQREGANRQ